MPSQPEPPPELYASITEGVIPRRRELGMGFVKNDHEISLTIDKASDRGTGCFMIHDLITGSQAIVGTRFNHAQRIRIGIEIDRSISERNFGFAHQRQVNKRAERVLMTGSSRAIQILQARRATCVGVGSGSVAMIRRRISAMLTTGS